MLEITQKNYCRYFLVSLFGWPSKRAMRIASSRGDEKFDNSIISINYNIDHEEDIATVASQGEHQILRFKSAA